MACLTKELKQSTDNSMPTKQNNSAHFVVNKTEKHYVVESSSKSSNNQFESVLLIKSLNVS